MTVAAYLAKAGVNVCVVERQDKIGGGVITREVTLPGFKHDLGAIMHMAVRANPLIHQDELSLVSKYGLKYVLPDPQLAVIFPDDRALVIYRDVDKTRESIAQFSKRDAEAYPRFVEYMKRMSRIAGVASFSPPIAFGRMVALLDESDDGREYLRIMLSSAEDIVDDWFESEQVKIGFTRFASEAMTSPRKRHRNHYVSCSPVSLLGVRFTGGRVGGAERSTRCLHKG